MEQRQLALPRTIPGTETTVTALCYGASHAARKVYIQASLHADELPGALAAWHVCQRLQVLEEQGAVNAQIIVVPLSNPVGLRQTVLYDHQGRFDLATGQNFNRLRTIGLYDKLCAHLQSLPQPLGQNAKANTQTIRKALHEVLQAWQPQTTVEALHSVLLGLSVDADVVLDLHCDKNATVHIYTLPQHWAAVQPLACWLGSRCQILSENSGAQSFDEVLAGIWLRLQQDFPDVAIDLACCAVTVELRGEHDLSHTWAAQDADAILQYLHHTGDVRLPADAQRPMPALLAEPHPLSGLVYVPTPIAGIVVYHVAPGDWVQAGQLLAEVVDPLQAQPTPVHSTVAGCVFTISDQCFVRPENELMTISAAQDLGHVGLSP